MVWKHKLRDILFSLLVVCLGIGLLVWPKDVVEAGRSSLNLCANVIIPSLFPFFVLSSLIIGLGLAERLGHLLRGVMGPVFGLNGNCAAALVLGLIGGYPVGAKTAAELYQSGLCSKSEAERMLGFCNNAGPSFLLGVVGAGVFGNARVGFLLAGVHILSALLVGLLFRRREAGQVTRKPVTPTRTAPVQVFTEGVKNSFATLLNVCAFILLFGVVLQLGVKSGLIGGLAQLLTPYGLNPLWVERLLSGMVELSNGVTRLPPDIPHISIPMAAFLLGWGGISVLCQTMSVVQGSGLSIKNCVLGKLLHGGISAALAWVAVRMLPGVIEASAHLTSPTPSVCYPSGADTLLISLVFSALILLLCKNRGGNRQNGGV